MRHHAQPPQAIHQMLIFLPLGLLAAAVVFDLIDLATGTGAFAVAAYWMVAGGLVGGLLAAPFGLVDLLRIPAGTRARHTGALHGAGNVLVLLLFSASWLLRDSQGGVPAAALAFSFTAVIVSMATALLGSRLAATSRLHDEAHTESLSSLNFDERPSRSSARAH